VDDKLEVLVVPPLRVSMGRRVHMRWRVCWWCRSNTTTLLWLRRAPNSAPRTRHGARGEKVDEGVRVGDWGGCLGCVKNGCGNGPFYTLEAVEGVVARIKADTHR
jgi:hypothetical protein